MRTLISIAIASIIGSSAVAAQPVDGLAGQSVQTFVLTRSGTLIAGTERSGALRSTDGGASWAATTLRTENVRTLTTDGTGSVYAGVGGWRGGVFRSDDDGTTWTKVGPTKYVEDLVSGPDGTLYVATRGGGAFLSRDRGITWQGFSRGFGMTSVLSLARSPQGRLFTGMSSGGGIYWTDDEGTNWTRPERGPMRGTDVRSIIVLDDGSVLAGTTQGIFRSRDGGRAWENVRPGLSVWTIGTLPDGTLAAATEDGLWRSADGGEAWARYSAEGRRVMALQQLANGTVVLGFGNAGGTIRVGEPAETAPAHAVTTGTATADETTGSTVVAAGAAVVLGTVVEHIEWPVPSMAGGIIVEDGRARYRIDTWSRARVPMPEVVGGTTSDLLIGSSVRVEVNEMQRVEPGFFDVNASRITLRPERPRLTVVDRVSFDGMGPVRIGMSVSELARGVGQPMARETLPSECDRFDRECHIQAARCYSFAPAAVPEVSFMMVDGMVARVNVYSSSVKTAEGAGVGDSESRIRSLYPEAQSTRHPYNEDGHYLTVTGPGSAARQRRIVFETDGQKVTSYRAGSMPAVMWIEGCL